MADKLQLTVLVAPLDWGLGHATRCIPVIEFLLQSGCKVLIAAEGLQENLLKAEFPHATFLKLAGYRIRYSNNKRWFVLKIIQQLPKIILAIRNEHKWLGKVVKTNKIDAIISDNRYGLHGYGIPSVIITHQLVIKAKFSFVEKILQKINYSFIEKFSACWVPDKKGAVNLAGRLSHPRKLPNIPLQYIGNLSRLESQNVVKPKYKALIILSGIEPQRTQLENRMLKEAASFPESILLLRGLPESSQMIKASDNVVVKNHLPAKEMQQVFTESEYIISRSGYTTIMDICKLQKKSILIPTPGQTEQEYLAKHLHKQKRCLVVEEGDFSLTNAMNEAALFDYLLPVFDMHQYQQIIDSFLRQITHLNFKKL